LVPALQLTAVAVAEAEMAEGSVSVTLLTIEQEASLASLMVTLYVPAAREEIDELVPPVLHT
jgi:hypothetical protein